MSERPLEALGRRFTEAREKRGRSLREIADKTRIQLGTLEAIESGDHSALPAPVFVKGFLRAYALQLGLDPNEIILEYRTARPGSDEISVGVPPTVRKQVYGSSRPWTMALAVIVILAGIAGGYLYYNRPDRSPADLSQETASTSPEQKSESDQPERPEARTETPEKPPLPSRAASEATTSDTARPAAEAAGAQPSAPAERSAMTTMSETSSETAPGSAPGRETETAALTGQETRPPAEEAREEAAPREGHELTLTFHRECWVGLGIDNDVKVQKTYRAGESMTWKARKGFALRLGNYQGAKIVFDGRPVVKKLPSDQWILNLILPEGSRDIKSINWSAEKLE